MTYAAEKKPPEHGDEPRSEDLALDDTHAEDKAKGVKTSPPAESRCRVAFTFTKTVDKASP